MILVTGATGFIGNALRTTLAERGMSYRPVSRSPQAGFYRIGEMGSETNWIPALAGVATVIHLAARVHVMQETNADPEVAFRQANVDATLQLARQAAAAGVQRFIFLSSIKVNGESTEPGRPFKSTDRPNPSDAYGRSKRDAEQALMELGRETGMAIVIIRPPLVYGPGVKANFASLLKWARRGVPLPFGRVANKRSLVFVGNLVDLIISCVEHPEAAGRTFLVSDGDDLSIGALIAMISDKMDRRARLLPVPPSLMTTAATTLGRGAAAQRLLGSLQVDISETRRILDWAPPFSADEGLAQTVQAFLNEKRPTG